MKATGVTGRGWPLCHVANVTVPFRTRRALISSLLCPLSLLASTLCIFQISIKINFQLCHPVWRWKRSSVVMKNIHVNQSAAAALDELSPCGQAGRVGLQRGCSSWPGARAQECYVCCLNSGLSQCWPGGARGRKLLHVYIVELSFALPPPPASNALLFKHSQVWR